MNENNLEKWKIEENNPKVVKGGGAGQKKKKTIQNNA
jgi:hypothetical protein